jgi:hypothetical protein
MMTGLVGTSVGTNGQADRLGSSGQCQLSWGLLASPCPHVSGHARSGMGDPDLFVTKIEVSRQRCSISTAWPVTPTTDSADLARTRPHALWTTTDERRRTERERPAGPQADP